MKKFLFLFLFILILITGVWMLNYFGVVSLKTWSEKVITATPVLKEYVKTDQQYDKIFTGKRELETKTEELEEHNSELEYSLEQERRQVESQQEKIEELEEEVARLNEEKDNREQRISKLVEIYSQMEPESAAEIILSLDRDLSLTLLTRLEDEQAADILSELPSEEAVVLTEAIND